FFDAIGDPDALTAIFTENATWTIWGDFPFSGTHYGKRAVLEDFHGTAGALFATGDHGVLEITNLIGEGSLVAAEFHHKNKTAVGKDYHNYYVEVFEVREDGLIDHVREYCDTAHLRDRCY